MNDKKIPESGLSNHVLIFDSDDHKKVTLFLPAYMRFNFKKMTSIDIAETQARMSGALLLSIYYKGVTDDIVKRIESGIEVSLNQEEFHTISNNNPHHQKSGKMHITRDEDNWLIHATWRNQFPLELACKDVFYSPFSLIDLGFEVSLRSFKFVNSDNVKYSVKFNLMRLEPECGESIYQMFSVRKDDRGEYSVAQGKVNVSVYNPPEEEKEKDRKDELGRSSPKKSQKIFDFDSDSSAHLKKPADSAVEGTIQDPLRSKKDLGKQSRQKLLKQFGTFQSFKVEFGMYKYPFSTVITLFLPLMMLGVLNLAVFFQENSLSGRVSSLATIMVAYAAFLPTIRDRIPPSPSITAMDLILVALCSNCMLCLLRSFLDFSQDQSIYLYDWKQDAFYLLCLTTIITVVLIILIALLIYKVVWEPIYNKPLSKSKVTNSDKFKSRMWGNPQCDELVRQLLAKHPNQLRILEAGRKDSIIMAPKNNETPGAISKISLRSKIPKLADGFQQQIVKESSPTDP